MLTIEILSSFAAPDPTLGSQYSPASGSGGARFKVINARAPSREKITEAFSRWNDDTMVMSYDHETGTGFFRVVDGDGPAPGTLVSLPFEIVWHVYRDDQHLMDVLAFDKISAIDRAWEALDWVGCPFNDHCDIDYADASVIQVRPSLQPEVTYAISEKTRAVILGCPVCGSITTLEAASWSAINTEGVFKVTPGQTFASSCLKCLTDFVFIPTLKSVEDLQADA